MYRLYVGSPNDSHRLNDELIDEIITLTRRDFAYFTYHLAKGVYRDIIEDTLVIIITEANKQAVENLGRKICHLMKQDAVAIEHADSYQRLVSDT